jgi:hypothetical protein
VLSYGWLDLSQEIEKRVFNVLFLTFIAEWIIGGDVAHPLLPVWLAIPIIGLLTFLCCAVTTKLISQIPGSKYIIG